MSSLTDRYLAATLRAVPAPRRAEIADELRASIADMIDGRTDAGQDRETAEREVLTELGNPERLAARYADHRLQLIGPTYYLAWRRLLRLLLATVPIAIGALVAVLDAVDGGSVGSAIGVGGTTGIEVVVQVAFWVTLTFAVVERLSLPVRLPRWTVDQLPEDRPAGRAAPLADTAVSIAALVLLIAFLPWQHFRSWVRDDAGDHIPVLDPALWRFWLPALIALLVAEIALQVARHRAGRWTWPLVATKVTLDLAFAVPVAWLVLTDRLLNPEFVQRVDWLRDGANLDVVYTIALVAVVASLVRNTVAIAGQARRRAA
ncbi:permease prefix domain 1-containing protein [Micromonospora carbonacea]|uniref:permease prefix domain 1-containing protein n=1 Tax=Micromonospora carbonacea TaxID=47853 RepID=UPI003D719285